MIYILKYHYYGGVTGYLICDMVKNKWLYELNDENIIALQFKLPSDLQSVNWNNLD